ncbi:hypothetical protein BJY01DRAFT_249889 [Aspergillus pseudoustus]|uniref:Fungal-specific transcription factor domain-containing protein n=1 Tax=Aspergillus pseudoustus TaxID=1810923 RepID=A0ABR4JKU3_9EURO
MVTTTIPTDMWMFPAVDKHRLLTEDECRSLEFFHVQTSACFGGHAGGYLLHAAGQDAGIRLAAIALGTMHRLVMYREDRSAVYGDRGGEGMQLALQQYNAAIRRGLAQFLGLEDSGADNAESGSGSGSADGILAMCVLFFCFESLQGHYRAALRHSAAGLRILAQQQQQQQQWPAGSSNSLLPADVVHSIFATLEAQMLEVDGQAPLFRSNGNPLLCGDGGHQQQQQQQQQPLWTLEEANDRFRLIYNDLLRLLGSVPSDFGQPRIEGGEEEMARLAEHLLPRYHQVQEDLNTWALQFDYFLTNSFSWDNTHRASQQLVRMLHLWHCMVRMILRMGWPPSESVWDSYLGECTTILDLAEEIIATHPRPVESYSGLSHGAPGEGFISSSSSSSSPSPSPSFPSSNCPSPSSLPPKHGSSPPAPAAHTHTYARILPRPAYPSSLLSPPSHFSMSLGIIPALWTIATHCRDSLIRYRAIDLIARSKRREGVWDSALYSRLARQIARREEAAAGIALGAAYTPVDIPPEARVTIHGRLEEGRRARVTYIKGDVGYDEEVLCW